MAVGNEAPNFIAQDQPSENKTAQINTNFQNLYNSLNLSLKAVDSGTFNVTAVAGSVVTGTYAHNLSYAPVILVSIQKGGTGNVYQVPYLVSTSSSTNYVLVSAYTDTTTLTVSFDLGSGASGSAGSWKVYYYLLRQNAV